jgi:hypothetical protein
MIRLVGLLRAGRSRTKTVALATVLVLTAGAVAIAAPSGVLNPGTSGPQGIVTVGPVNPSNGFPDWYRDTNGVDLAPCDDPQDPFCGGAVAAPDNTAPITFPDNFPDEFFYQDATADGLTSAGGQTVLAEFAIEGAFASGPPTAGDQIVFSRIRYRINDGLKPDTDYKITHPYGTDTVHTDPGATGFFVTQDVGVSPGDFAQALKGRVGPFLEWAPNSNDATDVPPAGYIGDGVTPHKVKGSELGTNFVRIQGPGIGGADGSTNPNPCPTTGPNAYTGPVNDCIQSDNFVLVGKKSTIAGVDVARATYDKTSTSTQIQVLAGSKSGQDIVVQDGDNGPGPGRLMRTTPMRGDGGRYMARVDVPGALPKSIDVVNRGDVPTTTKHVELTDSVTATAVYHTTKGGGDKLHITASSSDETLAGSELTLPGFGNKALDATGQTDIETPAPPDTVTVKSSKGGSVTVPVAIDGEGLDALPLLVNAGPDQTVEQGAKVTLDGSGSAGDIDSLSWSGPDGITLTGADQAKATFTAPSEATSLTFTLTVKSGTTTKTDDVVIKVNPANPVSAQIAPVGATVLQNLPLTLDASSSVGGAKFEWSQVPGDATPVTLSGDTTSSKLTFLFPKTTTPIHIQVRVRSASDPGTGCSAPTCDTAVITLTPQLDNLTNIRAKNDGKGRWVVDGNSNVLVSNNVRVYAGATIGTSANLIGTALVDPTGSWKVDVRDSQVAVPACRCVSVESDRGGKVLDVPMS